MLAQHLITKPVFDALFDEYSFAAHNPMAIAMQKVLDVLDQHQLDSETEALQRFYDSVKLRASGIDSAEGKQKIIVELYDKFFRNAFPRMTERLGIVYTPVEVVDFIIHSVNDVLQQEFGKSFADEGVHVLDPFTGTGTFISRLLQSGLIPPKKLTYKYKNEIHANELVLLAYYIAAINIEAVYHSEIIDEYTPFEGICLTDTFQMYEKEDLVDHVLVDNSARRKRQKSLDIQVIIGNPPYSTGQESANDENQNLAYPELDLKIKQTYAKESKATLQRNLYDSYIRAFRWASDRLKNQGVIGFVSGSGFIEKPAMDGMRKTLFKEFSKIYIFNLRGDIRKNILSKGRAKEGQNIFENGSMTGITITILVKGGLNNKTSKIFYRDIGNDLKLEEKKKILRDTKSISNINWKEIIQDEYGDWINQRDNSFENYLVLGDKKNKRCPQLFNSYSLGVSTNRDAWCYNFSKKILRNNVNKTIKFYNSEVDKYEVNESNYEYDLDASNISWSRGLKNRLLKKQKIQFTELSLVKSLYLPFTKIHVYFNDQLNEMVLLNRKLFPKEGVENLVIIVTGVGARSGFSSCISNTLTSLHTLDTAQNFPLYLYDEIIQKESIESCDLFDNSLDLTVSETKYQRKDGISDEGLEHFQAAYPNEQITKEDIFYYTYGLLHSEEYRVRYADNLTKELPRIPCVKKAEDFWAFSKAGRELAHWHLNYETIEPYKATLDTGSTPYSQLSTEDFYVEKMKFAKKGEKGTVIYNKRITIKDIPVEAYEYVVNGKPALEWVMERQGVSTHKDSGIVNDANDWAIETMNNPAYPLELFLRVITVSLETMKIVRALPKLDI